MTQTRMNTPDGMREVMRQEMNDALQRHFEGNLTRMVAAMGYTDDDATRVKVDRILKGKTKKIDPALWTDFEQLMFNLKMSPSHTTEQESPVISNVPSTYRPGTADSHMSKVSDLFSDSMTLDIYTNVRASAGNGALIYDEDKESLTVPRGLMMRLLGFSPPRQLGVLFIDGDSMSPALEDGDMALWTPVSDITDGGIYAIILDGALIAKRIQKIPGGGLYIISDNKYAGYRDAKLIPGDSSLVNADTGQRVEVHVVGRIIWPRRDYDRMHVKQVAELIRNLTNGNGKH